MLTVVTKNTVRCVIIYRDPPQIIYWEEKRDNLALSEQTKLCSQAVRGETDAII